MRTNTVKVTVNLYDDAPGPQVVNLASGGAAAVELIGHPAAVKIVASSVEQADRQIAAWNAAKELLTGGAS